MRIKIFGILLIVSSIIAYSATQRPSPSNVEIVAGLGSYAQNGQTSSIVSVTSSPFSFTNGQSYSVFVYIGAGVVNTISVNGGSLAAGLTLTGLTTVGLQSGEYITITYTVAPTMKWKPL